jgi:hypothetical protein
LSTDSNTPHEKSQSALVEFLQVDLDLCFTMLQTARITSEHAHYEQATRNVREGLDTIRSLVARVEDPAISSAIDRRADELGRALDSLAGEKMQPPSLSS